MRIGDRPARRVLVAYLVVVTVARLLASAMFVMLLPLTIALLSDDLSISWLTVRLMGD